MDQIKFNLFIYKNLIYLFINKKNATNTRVKINNTKYSTKRSILETRMSIKVLFWASVNK